MVRLQTKSYSSDIWRSVYKLKKHNSDIWWSGYKLKATAVTSGGQVTN